MLYYIANRNDPSTPYHGGLWSEIELEPEYYIYIEDAIEVASIFNSITKSDNYLINYMDSTYPFKEEL